MCAYGAGTVEDKTPSTSLSKGQKSVCVVMYRVSLTELTAIIRGPVAFAFAVYIYKSLQIGMNVYGYHCCPPSNGTKRNREKTKKREKKKRQPKKMVGTLNDKVTE